MLNENSAKVAEQEMTGKRLKRDAEDALLRLKSADQALLDKDQEADRLEGRFVWSSRGDVYVQWKLLI